MYLIHKGSLPRLLYSHVFKAFSSTIKPEAVHYFSLILTAVDEKICISFSQETNLMSYDYTNKRLRRLITIPQEGQPPFKQWLWLVRYDDNVSIHICF